MNIRTALNPAEPFRLFFPLGLLIGLAGVVVWPLYQMHLLAIYPSVMHARLMTEGFLAAFAFGFLGTAGPRMLSAPPLAGRVIRLLLVLHASAAVCHLMGRYFWGDALFLITLLTFVGMFAGRFAVRKDLPPPQFVLVALGFLSGLTGIVLLLVGTPVTYFLGSRLLFEGFFLLPMLGIGTFLFPRFLGLPIPEAFPDSRTPPAWWWRSAGRAAAFGLVILATYFVETMGYPRSAILVRFAAACAFLLPQAPFLRGRMPGTLAGGLKLAIALMFLGLVLTAAFLRLRVAMLHVVFIGGFGLIVFLVATRVMFGHSGFGQLLTRRAPFLIVFVTLTLLALVIRIVADFFPDLRLHLVATSALLWLGAALTWSVRAIPKIFIPDPEP